jgi:hypothetical protein
MPDSGDLSFLTKVSSVSDHCHANLIGGRLVSLMIKTQQKRDFGNDLDLVELLVQPVVGPCVSIVIGLHKELNQRKQNITLIRQAILKAHVALENFPCPVSTRQLIADRLDSLVKCVQLEQPEAGIGLFVSPQVSTLITFPFQVNEVMMIGNSFESRDILYLKQYLTPYYIVSLAKSSVRLFRAHADSMEEIRDGFPFLYKDDYEYARSSQASSFGYGKKGFEKDKSIVAEMRSASLVRDAAHHLCMHAPNGISEIALCGPARLIKEFTDACSPRDRILVKVPGTHNAGEFASLIQTAWTECQLSRKNEIEKLIAELDDLGLNYKAIGIRDVWSAAAKGNGLLLLVERDYQRAAYVPEGNEGIRLHPPTEKYEVIADAVDDVIEKVLRGGGKVVFTESNQLRKFEQMGLMLRHK